MNGDVYYSSPYKVHDSLKNLVIKPGKKLREKHESLQHKARRSHFKLAQDTHKKLLLSLATGMSQKSPSTQLDEDSQAGSSSPKVRRRSILNK